MYLYGNQMRPMPILHEMYFMGYLVRLIMCQSRPPCQSHPHLRYLMTALVPEKLRKVVLCEKR